MTAILQFVGCSLRTRVVDRICRMLKQNERDHSPVSINRYLVYNIDINVFIKVVVILIIVERIQ